MIDINKKYRTRDGREVRIYAVNGGGGCPVHGTIFSKELGWMLATWSVDGCALNDINHPSDLVEVKPRIKRTMWVNVCPNTITTFFHRLDADNYAGSSRLACVKVEIDCAEGEGL
tara:strand:+ start:690 stop:1034 length:345 start_codon:yes stop_codon:yes gene_type:complete